MSTRTGQRRRKPADPATPTSGAEPANPPRGRRAPFTVEDAFRLRLPSDARLAPDGRHVAFTVAEWVAGQVRQRSRVWVVDVEGGEPRALAIGPRHDASPRWSPDGRSLAVVSERDRQGDAAQLYVVPAGGGEARQVCDVPNGVEDIAWSPDGARLAFVSPEGPEPPRDPIVGSRLERHRRLWTVGLADGRPEPVTPADRTVWRYAWSPDGARFALYYADEAGETAWYRGQLGLVPAGGGPIARLGHLERQAAALAWSPDGARLAYVLGEWSDRPVVGGDLWVAPADGGAARNLTPGAEVSVTWAAWLPDGESLLIHALDGVASLVGLVPAGGGAIRPLAGGVVLGEEPWPRLSASAGGARLATTGSAPDRPPEIWLGERSRRDDAIAWRALTHLNDEVAGALALSPTEVVSYPGADGWRIDALLTMPRESRRGSPPPLILYYHGGPTAANRAGFALPPWIQQWAAAGFAVLAPNFRGSLGRGIAFADAILGDIGGKDLEDCLRGVDHLVRAGRVDGERLGVMGWSYGGFAVAWAITQTARFKAAVMGAGICDFHGYHAQANIPDWDRRFLAADPAADPAAYRARSAITHIARARTPTLIVHGERDECVPVGQAYAFYRGLRERGVPSELVVYPREGHGFVEGEHVRDRDRRMLEWLERYL
jgi:dipeptidyl aminopeptidase/acylaminoacyl peptidase